MESFYKVLADIILYVHFGFVAFVLIGLVLILLGILFKWNWVRGFWFRTLHLTAIAIVALETLAGIECPLTTWEVDLREAAGVPVNPGEDEFVAHWVNEVLFAGAGLEESVLHTIYILLAVLIIVVYIIAPPRLPAWLTRRKPDESAEPVSSEQQIAEEA